MREGSEGVREGGREGRMEGWMEGGRKEGRKEGIVGHKVKDKSDNEIVETCCCQYMGYSI